MADIRLLREGFAAFTAGGVDATANLLADNFEFHDHHLIEGPVGGSGRESIDLQLEKVADAFGETSYELREVTDLGSGRYLCEVPTTARGYATGEGLELQITLWQIWEIRDGKAVRVDVWGSREEAEAAL